MLPKPLEKYQTAGVKGCSPRSRAWLGPAHPKYNMVETGFSWQKVRFGDCIVGKNLGEFTHQNQALTNKAGDFSATEMVRKNSETARRFACHQQKTASGSIPPTKMRVLMGVWLEERFGLHFTSSKIVWAPTTETCWECSSNQKSSWFP